MHKLDETDAEILRQLTEDGRRPYSRIAETVGLSAPAVRDRIDRLTESGVIRRITVDVDRSLLEEGIPVLVDIVVLPDAVSDVRDALSSIPAIEHVFVAAEPRIIFQARMPKGDVVTILDEYLDLATVQELEVTLLTETQWTPAIVGSSFAIECAECGNTVTAEGESTHIDGEIYHFCCSSCRDRFESQYEELRESA